MTTGEALETDLITTPEPRRTALTEDEILTGYGGLIWEALQAFGEDPTYFADMCETANLIEYKRDIWESGPAKAGMALAVKARKLRHTLGEKVEVRGKCWIWLASTTKGTPIMRVPGAGRTAPTTTARSWVVEQFHGPDDTRWMVTASCGNRLCVNPRHATWRTVERH